MPNLSVIDKSMQIVEARTETILPSSRPRVIINQQLDRSEVPYTVTFDNDLYANLLRTFGMSDEDIARTKVN